MHKPPHTPKKTQIKQTNKQSTSVKHVKNPIKGLEVRQAASRILSAVLDKKISLDGLFDNQNGHPHYLALPLSERGLCRAILQTSLRHHIALDRQLNHYLKNPLPKNAKALRHLLHIGAAQILYLRIPTHAAIFLSVAHAKCDPRTKRFSGLVNAILRKFSIDGEKYPLNKDPLSHVPDWFRQILLQNYPKNLAEQIIRAQNFLPNLDIHLKNPNEDNLKEWSKTLDAVILPSKGLRLKNPQIDVPKLPGFQDGAWFVQNCAAALPVKIMGDIKGKKIGDLCAAPGGKTAQMAALGAKVTAMDNVETRLNRVKENMKRLNLKIKSFLGDFQTYPEKEAFDIVLLDVPCSSTGTIRRHIDVLWTKSHDDIAALSQLQKQMLHDALDLLKKGGMLIFSNCSLSFEEGETLIKDFLKTRDDVALSRITSEEYPELAPFLNKDHCLRTTPASMPHEDENLAGMDGFFAARLIKKSA